MTLISPFPKHVSVRITPLPPEGLMVNISFQMIQKNSFNYVVFVDANGRADIYEEELLKSFDQDRSAFINDYVNPRTSFTGKITANVLSPAELRNALRVFEIYSKYLPYPRDYEQKLRRALEQNQDPKKFRVEVTFHK